MRLWSRFFVVVTALTLALSLSVAPAQAAKKKKEKEKKETKRESKSTSYEAPRKHYLTGTDLEGRSGLFYGQTSDVAATGAWEGSLHATWQSPASGYDYFGFPIGAHFGIDKDLELSLGARLDVESIPSFTIFGVTYGGSSSIFTIQGGAKYHIAGEGRNAPDFSVGGTLYVPTYSGGQVVVMPEGTVSYILKNGLLLNGDFGVGISNVSYVKFDGGVAYPFSPKVTGIAEIGANQGTLGASGYGNSMFAVGGRFALGDSTKAQALLGVPLNGGGVVLGAGIILASK